MRWLPLAPLLKPRRNPRVLELTDGRVLVEDGALTGRGAPPAEVWSPEDGAWRLASQRVSRAGPVPPPEPEGLRVTSVEGRRCVQWLEGGRQVSVSLSVERERPTVVALPRARLLVAGGYREFTSFSMDDETDSVGECELVDLAARSVVPAGTLTPARHAFGTVVLRSGAVLLVGGVHDDELPGTAVTLGLPDDFEAWDAFGPALRAQLQRAADAWDRQATVDALGHPPRGQPPARRLEAARAALARWPKDAALHDALGRAALEAKRPAEAVEAFAAATRLKPKDPFAFGALGAALELAGRGRDALAAWERVLTLTRGEDQTWTWSLVRDARSHVQALRLSNGSAADRRRVAAGHPAPTTSPEWNNRGAALLGLARPKEAARCLREAVKLDRDNDVAWLNLSIACLQAGQPAEAKRAAEAALERRTEPARRQAAWVQRGVACYDLGDFRESVRCYDRALRAHPTGLAHSNRGNSWLKLGRPRVALRCYDRAQRLGFDASWGRACALCALGRLQEAHAEALLALKANCGRASEILTDPELAAVWARYGRP